mmetsp:Transcript_13469/g.43660  ORF Transcript_13469/g.43660 Transcript_13469/m.43660 type:complete len:219 (+) Transcript_13469:685-1341(+)
MPSRRRVLSFPMAEENVADNFWKISTTVLQALLRASSVPDVLSNCCTTVTSVCTFAALVTSCTRPVELAKIGSRGPNVAKIFVSSAAKCSKLAHTVWRTSTPLANKPCDSVRTVTIEDRPAAPAAAAAICPPAPPKNVVAWLFKSPKLDGTSNPKMEPSRRTGRLLRRVRFSRTSAVTFWAARAARSAWAPASSARGRPCSAPWLIALSGPAGTSPAL